MSAARRLDLSRLRDVSALLGDSFGLLLRNLRTFFAIAAAVVVPVQLIVSGIGLERLTAGYEAEPEPAQLLVPVAVAYLVTAPLLAAMTVHAVLEAADGRPPSAGRSIQAGLDVFAPVFAAILLAAIGVGAGLVAFVLPGVYLAVRWYFVAQAVVIEDRRGLEALRRSGELVRGSWWRVFGITLLFGVIAALPAALVQQPLALAAEASDRAAFELGGAMLAQIVSGPFIAIAGTLLYFDLVARRAGAAPPPVVPPPAAGPPDPPGLPER